MNKITVKIEGMSCSMCEAHVADAIRRGFPEAKKVSASRRSGEATFLTEVPVDEEKLKKTVTDTGYGFISVISEPYQKRGLFGRS